MAANSHLGIVLREATELLVEGADGALDTHGRHAASTAQPHLLQQARVGAGQDTL